MADELGVLRSDVEIESRLREELGVALAARPVFQGE